MSDERERKQQEWNKTFYQKHKEQRYEINKKQKEYLISNINNFLSSCSCSICESAADKYFFQNQEGALFHFTQAVSKHWSWKRTKEEVSLYQCFCPDCFQPIVSVSNFSGKESEKRKREQLGMSSGKARQILVKNIMFMFAQKCQMDDCFVCGKKITDIDEFTIEHKKPWLDKDVGLFWDLTNIAFSHRKCNRPHTIGAHKLRKECPEGMGWCRVCKDFVRIEQMNHDKSNWNDLGTLCLMHHAEQAAERRQRGFEALN